MDSLVTMIKYIVLIAILYILVITLLFFRNKTEKKLMGSGNPFCCVTVIHCILLLFCYSTGKVNANKRDYKATCIFN